MYLRLIKSLKICKNVLFPYKLLNVWFPKIHISSFSVQQTFTETFDKEIFTLCKTYMFLFEYVNILA